MRKINSYCSGVEIWTRFFAVDFVKVAIDFVNVVIEFVEVAIDFVKVALDLIGVNISENVSDV